jgi:hypothetical protein
MKESEFLEDLSDNWLLRKDPVPLSYVDQTARTLMFIADNHGHILTRDHLDISYFPWLVKL